MTVRYDGGSVDDAAARLRRRVQAARLLVAAAARLDGSADGGLVDRHLALAAVAVADLTGDGAELVARDLQLLVDRLLRGALLLDATEVALAKAAVASGGPRRRA